MTVAQPALEPQVGLADADLDALEREAALQLVGDRGRKRLEQLEVRAVRDLAHAGDEVAVVDRGVDVVLGGLGHLERRRRRRNR